MQSRTGGNVKARVSIRDVTIVCPGKETTSRVRTPRFYVMIWILLPAYNEEDTLPRLLPKIRAFAEQCPSDCRLVVVNDGSRDGTAAVLANFSANWPIHIITHKINRGLGETERDGFEYIAEASHPSDIIVRLDADDSHEPEYILRLIEKVNQGFDVVNTSRFRPGGGQKGVNTYRTVISCGANLFMACMFHIPGVRDYTCGFRAYRAKAIQDCVRLFGNDFIQLKGLGFTSTLEMLVKLKLVGCRFAEVPFVLRYDQKTSASKMLTSITMLGYFSMALLYHWPFSGWRVKHRKLKARLEAESVMALSETQSKRAGA